MSMGQSRSVNNRQTHGSQRPAAKLKFACIGLILILEEQSISIVVDTGATGDEMYMPSDRHSKGRVSVVRVWWSLTCCEAGQTFENWRVPNHPFSLETVP
jgi:hypothetical protein